jgi:uncharacterized membrane protein
MGLGFFKTILKAILVGLYEAINLSAISIV